MGVFDLVDWLRNFIGRLAVFLVFITWGAAAHAATYTFFTLTFDEFGNCSSTFGTCTHTIAPDPTTSPGTKAPGDVLIYNLPELTFTGNVNILDASGAVSDHLRFIDATGSADACTAASGLAICGNRMIFYSLDSTGAPADVGPLTFSALVSTTENADGTFQFNATGCGQSVCNVYDGVSTVPLPAALPLFATGLGALGLLGWRRKRKNAAANVAA